MYGPVIIEAENSDGDRRAVRTVDIEGLPQGTHIRKHLREIARHELGQPSVYCVRAFVDTGDIYRRLFTIT